ncbi:POTRA domain-containing protein [uncultured Albimonas sp.]|uniref:ShlB/FhaC/HecB family hemolysin secretion/activation protein n=1 Tax=uncultured Albimonas sp. TaxID=1331701 RepID=UPI0030EE3C69|tara:strand:+ start:220 stop:1962 length:1743 start_codon:yes stop_codon:yes gene_type:complete
MLALLVVFSAAPSWAQSPPPVATRLPDPGQTLREATERARPEPGALAPSGEIQFTSQTPPANARDIRFELTGVTLVGATIYDEAVLAQDYAEALGREVDLTELFAIAARIQSRYRDDGYLFTRVVVPAQRIEGGRARLEVVEAVITRVAIEAPELPIGPVRALAEQFAAPLEGLRNPTLEALERVLLQLNDIPGITRAAAVPKVGADERGAIELYINMEREPFSLTAFADNRQSPIIGPGLVGLVGSFNSWSPAGDTSTLSWFNSADYEDPLGDSWGERWTLQFEHQRFLGSSGLSGHFRALYSESAPGDIVKGFDIDTDQTEIELGLRYPALRTRAISLDLFGGLEAVQVNSLTPSPVVAPIPGLPGVGDLVTDDRLNVLFVGYEGVLRDENGFTEGRFELRQGLPILGTSRAGDPNLSRQDGDGVFTSVRAELARTQVLGEGFSLWGKAWAQTADRALLASEEMSIGGPELGRAYHPSEYSGDVGLGGAAELRYANELVFDALRAPYEVYGFMDWAEVRNLDGGAPPHAEIFSAGFGVRATFPGRLSVNLEAAKPINVPLAYDQSRAWRLLFSAVKEF